MSKIIVLRPRPKHEGTDALIELLNAGDNHVVTIAYTTSLIDFNNDVDPDVINSLMDRIAAEYTNGDVIVSTAAGAAIVIEWIEHLTRDRSNKAGEIWMIGSTVSNDITTPIGTFDRINNILDMSNEEDVMGGQYGHVSGDENFFNIHEVLEPADIKDDPAYDIEPGYLYNAPRLARIVEMITGAETTLDEVPYQP